MHRGALSVPLDSHRMTIMIIPWLVTKSEGKTRRIQSVTCMHNTDCQFRAEGSEWRYNNYSTRHDSPMVHYQITKIPTDSNGLFTLGLDERHITIETRTRWFGLEGVVTSFGPMRPGKEEMPIQFYNYEYTTQAHEVLHLMTRSIALSIGMLLLVWYVCVSGA